MTNACSINLLESAVDGSLRGDDDVALQLHLDECESCSAALERMTGWTEWCKEAATLLTEDELDELHPSREDWAVDFTVEHLEPSEKPDAIGRLGEFDVLEIIGQGGMGVVLKAHDRKLNRYVAIKVLSPHLAQNSLARKRFAREAQAAAAVVHPHVLAIHQVQPNGALPYLVMPLVSGDSVAERLVRRGTLELTETLRIGMQAAAGLSAAHEQGLVHRDVKPANILLEKGVERAVLTDFGLARAADDVTLTRYGIIAGTPQYMSPEQARGEALDGRSDLFSLGCVLYEMSTGVSPFRADSLVATMRRLVEEQPRAMESLNPELPPWFVAIVERLLEKDASRRYSTAKEVSELLEGCLAHVQQPANVPLPRDLPRSKSAGSAFGHGSGRRWNRWGAVAAGVLLLGFGGAAAFMFATAEPSDISGEWTGDGWNQVTLKQVGAAEYSGTYTDTFGKEPGKIELKWSRIERRYNGKWSEGKDRFGKISVRQVGEEIRGAWTTNRKAEINPGTPELADLLWVRPSARRAEGDKTSEVKFTFGPVRERTLSSIETGKESTMQLNSGDVLITPEGVHDFDMAMRWMPAHEADIVACWDGGGRGLRIVGGTAIAPGKWDASPKEVLDSIVDMESQLSKYAWTIPDFSNTTNAGFSNLWATRNDQPVYFIRTRKATLGTLQILKMTKDPHTVTFRYKLLTEMAKPTDDAPKNVIEPHGVWRDFGKSSESDKPIGEAVRAFNEAAKIDSVGKDQPPLTEDELVSAVRWFADSEKDRLTAEDRELIKKIAQERLLPTDWEIKALAKVDGEDGERFQAWMIQLRKQDVSTGAVTVNAGRLQLSGDDTSKKVVHTVRQQLLGQLDANHRLIVFPPLKQSKGDDDATPLAAAIHDFNATHTSLCDIPQKPLTEEEVVGAIRWWKTRRNEAPVTNGAFAAFQKIADTRQLPHDATFELIPAFLNSDGSDFHTWSVRIMMPQQTKPGWTYAYVLREQHVRSEGSEEKNSGISWGSTQEDGLQAGVRLMPRHLTYKSGQVVTPVFYYRNNGKRLLYTSFPNLMTQGYYKKIVVLDRAGKEIPIEQQDQRPGVPAGWQEIHLEPGRMHEVSGLPILLGDGQRGSAETAIRAEPGQSVHVRFVLPRPDKENTEPIETGDAVFSIKAPEAETSEIIRRRPTQVQRVDAPK